MESFRKTLIFILLFILSSHLCANQDDFPIQSKDSPKFWLDVSHYQGSDNHTQLEIYYSIPSDELTYLNTSDNYIATISVSLIVKDSNDDVLINTSKEKKLRVNSIEDTRNEKNGLIDQMIIDLLPGNYTLEINIKDNNADSESKISSSLSVPSFSNSLDISTIQFASFITSGNNNHSFVKGNKSVIPNPSKLYTYNKSLLYIYYEVYNLSISDTSNKSIFEYRLFVTNQTNDTLIYTPAQSIAFSGSSCIQTKTLDIRDLKPGDYWVSISITDITSGISKTSINKFTINNSLTTNTEDSLPMLAEDIKKYRDQIKYFTTNNELELYDKLSNEGKKNFLINFWRSKDQSPETPENEFMLNSFARMDYANKNFENGIDSDMGRVFIIYGQPDEIENRTMNMDTKPYIIWEYFGTGTGKHQFVFVDKSGNQVYRLVHSTVDTEIYNSNWFEEIQQ